MATTAHSKSIPAPIRLTTVQWLICVIAAIGFAFDIYELLMLPLIMRPALLELTGTAPGSPEFQALGRTDVLRAGRLPAASSDSSAAI